MDHLAIALMSQHPPRLIKKWPFLREHQVSQAALGAGTGGTRFKHSLQKTLLAVSIHSQTFHGRICLIYDLQSKKTLAQLWLMWPLTSSIGRFLRKVEQ